MLAQLAASNLEGQREGAKDLERSLAIQVDVAKDLQRSLHMILGPLQVLGRCQGPLQILGI
jgi:hypothetical protein